MTWKQLIGWHTLQRENSLYKIVFFFFFLPQIHTEIRSLTDRRRKMAKPLFISLTIFLFIFNLVPSYALYGSSSPVLQLTPANFNKKVRIVKFYIFTWKPIRHFVFDSGYMNRVTLEFLLLFDSYVFIFVDLSV